MSDKTTQLTAFQCGQWVKKLSLDFWKSELSGPDAKAADYAMSGIILAADLGAVTRDLVEKEFDSNRNKFSDEDACSQAKNTALRSFDAVRFLPKTHEEHKIQLQ